MVVTGDKALNLHDLAMMHPEKSRERRDIMLLSKANPMVADCMWMPSNDYMQHHASIVVGLPEAELTRINKGVTPSKATREAITDGMSMIETECRVDERAGKIYGNLLETRRKEGATHIESLTQKMGDVMIYGSTLSNPLEYDGFDVRYGSTTGDTGENVILAGGSGEDQLSVYLVCWGQDKIHGIHPANVPAGLQREDYGRNFIPDSTGIAGAGNWMLCEGFRWLGGLHVADWRYAGRIANIEPADVVTMQNEQALNAYSTNLLVLMGRLVTKIPNMEGTKPVWYLPRTVYEGMIAMSIAGKLGSFFSITHLTETSRFATYMGIPVRPLDQLKLESAIS